MAPREIRWKTDWKVKDARLVIQRLYSHEDKVGVMPLKDPKGRSLHTLLLTKGKVLEAATPSVSVPPRHHPSWVSKMSAIAATAPELPMTVIRHHFRAKGETLDGDITSKALKKGWQRIVNRVVLKDFQFLPPLPTASPLEQALAGESNLQLALSLLTAARPAYDAGALGKKTVVRLKDLLRVHGCTVSGSKSDLLQRLADEAKSNLPLAAALAKECPVEAMFEDGMLADDAELASIVEAAGGPVDDPGTPDRVDVPDDLDEIPAPLLAMEPVHVVNSPAVFTRVSGTCFFSLLVPASMKALEYRVIVGLTVAGEVVTKVAFAQCPCIGGAGGDCTHVGALLLVIHNLYRPDTYAGAAVCTSALCRWNMPSPGVSYDFLRPVNFLRFTQENVNKPVKRECVMRESSWGRGGWNPFPEFLTLKTRADKAVQAATRALHLELESALGGKCGDQRQWPVDYVPAAGFASDPLDNERRARKLIILALLYLADKGFLVLDLLLEQDGNPA